MASLSLSFILTSPFFLELSFIEIFTVWKEAGYSKEIQECPILTDITTPCKEKWLSLYYHFKSVYKTSTLVNNNVLVQLSNTIYLFCTWG